MGPVRKFLVIVRYTAAAFFACVSLSAHAERVLALLQPASLEARSILESGIILGKTGASLEFLQGSLLVPSQVSIAAAFALSDSETDRASGWLWGAKASLSDSHFRENLHFYPGSSSFEFAIGRSTVFPSQNLLEGLRGYMEFSLRNEKTRLTDRSREIANDLGISYKENTYYWGLKMGTYSLGSTKPLMGQSARSWDFHVEGQIYFPLREAPHLFWEVKAAAYTGCGWKALRCGFGLSHWHLSGAEKTPTVDELSDLSKVLLIVAWRSSQSWDVRLQTFWNRIGNAEFTDFSLLPSVGLKITKSF